LAFSLADVPTFLCFVLSAVLAFASAPPVGKFGGEFSRASEHKGRFDDFFGFGRCLPQARIY
jgi:hypothetical protein